MQDGFLYGAGTDELAAVVARERLHGGVRGYPARDDQPLPVLPRDRGPVLPNQFSDASKAALPPLREQRPDERFQPDALLLSEALSPAGFLGSILLMPHRDPFVLIVYFYVQIH